MALVDRAQMAPTPILDDGLMGKNVADLADPTVACDACQASLGGAPAPVIDQTTGDERVYLAPPARIRIW